MAGGPSDGPSIEQLKKYAEDKGGKLLSEIYVNNVTLMLWECHKKHQWYSATRDIWCHKTWCVQCNKEKRTEKKTGIEQTKQESGV